MEKTEIDGDVWELFGKIHQEVMKDASSSNKSITSQDSASSSMLKYSDISSMDEEEYNKMSKLSNEDIDNFEVCDDCGGDLVTEKGLLKCLQCGIIHDKEIVQSAEWRYYGSEDTKNSDPTRCGMPVNVLLPESSVGTVVSNQFCKDKGMYRVKQYQSWTSMTYKERSIYKVFTEITEIMVN